MSKYWDHGKDKWIGDKQMVSTRSVKNKSRSQTAKGYSEGIESGFKEANKVFSPVVSSTGKQRIKNLLKSSKYKKGFEKGRKEAVKMIKKRADEYKTETLGLRDLFKSRKVRMFD